MSTLKTKIVLTVKTSMVFRALSVLSKKEQKKIFLVIILQIFLGLLDLAGIIVMGLLGSLAISGVGSGKPGDRVGAFLALINLTDKPLQIQVMYLGLIGAGLLTFKTLFSLYFTRKTLYFLSRRSAHLTSILISKLLAQPLLRIQARSLQETIYVLTAGVQVVTTGILGALIYLISDVSLLIILTAGLFVVDTLIAVSTLIIFGFMGFTLYYLMHVKIRDLGTLQAKLSIEGTEKISEVINSYRELVVRNRRHFYAREIGKSRMSLANTLAENTFLQNISKYVMEITVVVGSLVIGAIQFSIATATHAVAVLAIFLVAATRIAPAVLRIQQSFLGIKGSIGASSPTLALIEELGTEEPIANASDEVEFNYPDFKASIDISNVSLTYPGKRYAAVSNASLKISEGSIVAIVGPSGAGKTTLVDLLLGVLLPDEGAVTISGLSPSNAISKWSGAISYVPQDVGIINGTIRNNVGMGYSEKVTTDTLVESALTIAQLYNFVAELPNGLDTQVGDRGTKISGGQRQRLGIARAMFTKPTLLILDEATSSLDGETEANISEAIQAMRGSITVVMIAHRLSTVRKADKVIYMDKGKIISVGTFDEVRIQVPDFDRQAKLMGL